MMSMLAVLGLILGVYLYTGLAFCLWSQMSADLLMSTLAVLGLILGVYLYTGLAFWSLFQPQRQGVDLYADQSIFIGRSLTDRRTGSSGVCGLLTVVSR